MTFGGVSVPVLEGPPLLVDAGGPVSLSVKEQHAAPSIKQCKTRCYACSLALSKKVCYGAIIIHVHVHVAVSRFNTWRVGGTYYKGEGIAMYILGRGRKMG